MQTQELIDTVLNNLSCVDILLARLEEKGNAYHRAECQTARDEVLKVIARVGCIKRIRENEVSA